MFHSWVGQAVDLVKEGYRVSVSGLYTCTYKYYLHTPTGETIQFDLSPDGDEKETTPESLWRKDNPDVALPFVPVPKLLGLIADMGHEVDNKKR